MATHESDAQQHDSITAELETMRLIARALDGLHDPETRLRVLQWANDRYRIAAPAAPLWAAPAMAAAGDPTLAVETLQDLFEPGVASAQPSAQTAPMAPPRASMESVIKDFAADFRRFALEWQGA